jgi:hypothetical protein
MDDAQLRDKLSEEELRQKIQELTKELLILKTTGKHLYRKLDRATDVAKLNLQLTLNCKNLVS